MSSLSSHDFDRVAREYGAALARLASAYEQDPDEREDLLQDILFALWRALPTFRGDCSERTFVYRVAHNRALTHRKRSKVRGVGAAPLEDASDVADTGLGPADRAVSSERQEQLLAAVRRLPPQYRQVVMLRLEDLSNAEMAAVLGVNDNVVAIRLTRARKQLAELLSEEWSHA
jgi:RNA polymerase sigma factor (sigma-70 family)